MPGSSRTQARVSVLIGPPVVMEAQKERFLIWLIKVGGQNSGWWYMSRWYCTESLREGKGEEVVW